MGSDQFLDLRCLRCLGTVLRLHEGSRVFAGNACRIASVMHREWGKPADAASPFNHRPIWPTTSEAVTEMEHPNGVDRRRDALPVETVLAAYEIEAPLGAGGFGVVYRARHQLLDSVVALKEYYPAELAVREGIVVHPRSADHREVFEDGLYRFRDEAKRLIELNDHPAIVGCRDFFLANGTAYLVMEYVDGVPLSDLLVARERDGRPFDETDLLAVVEPLLEGLGLVHSAGVVHRDIKPSNILIRRADERPMLIDFGAAKQNVAEHTKSLAPYTDGFAAMEQVAEGELGPWTDLYAIGVVMWRMVAGGHASLDSPRPVKVERRANAQLRGDADPLPSVRRLGWGRFSDQVLTAIEGCLQLNSTDRPQACSEVLESLRESAQPEVHESPTPPRAFPPAHSQPRSKASRGVLFAVLVVAAILGIATLPVLLPLLVFESARDTKVEGQTPPQPSPIEPSNGADPESVPLPNRPAAAAPPPDPPEPNESEDPPTPEPPRPDGEQEQGEYSPGGGVTSPRLLYKVEPEYSEEARNAGIQGTVLLAVEVWEDGLAHNIRVLRSLGFGLDEKAIEAAQKWKFAPGSKNGEPVRVAAQIQMSFRLLTHESGPSVRAIPPGEPIDGPAKVRVESTINNEKVSLPEPPGAGGMAPVLAEGTEIAIRLAQPLSSAQNKAGERFRAHVIAPVELSDGSTIPVGSVAVGEVLDAQPAKRVAGQARLSVILRRLEFDRTQYRFETEPVVVEANGSKSRAVAKIGVAAGLGAIVGGLLDGEQGAARGAAIGGAGVLIAKGKEVELDDEHSIRFRVRRDQE